MRKFNFVSQGVDNSLKYENFEDLRTDCLKCKNCPLAETRKNVVFGVGNENSDILFVGEGPGANEDIQGEPFVGKAGQLLDKYLEVIGLSRKKNIYIANIVKCRPPENRDPEPAEQEACIEWLRCQTRLIKPKIIVCLGRIAAQKLISEDFKITRQHGEFIKKGNIIFTATYHPAALLRNPSNKADALSDFQKLRDKIKELNCDI